MSNNTPDVNDIWETPYDGKCIICEIFEYHYMVILEDEYRVYAYPKKSFNKNNGFVYLGKSKVNINNLFEVKKMIKLTPRVEEVCKLAAKGLLNKEIADIMGISEATVKLHIIKALRTFGVKNRVELALKYLEDRGLITINNA